MVLRRRPDGTVPTSMDNVYHLWYKTQVKAVSSITVAMQHPFLLFYQLDTGKYYVTIHMLELPPWLVELQRIVPPSTPIYHVRYIFVSCVHVEQRADVQSNTSMLRTIQPLLSKAWLTDEVRSA